LPKVAPGKKFRILLIADVHTTVLAGLASILEMHPDMILVATND